VASLVAAQRVAELAHYLSDVIAGAALGVLAFKLTLHLVTRADARLSAAAA
jgi:membrane-associated phospholipid phosphatase